MSKFDGSEGRSSPGGSKDFRRNIACIPRSQKEAPSFGCEFDVCLGIRPLKALHRNDENHAWIRPDEEEMLHEEERALMKLLRERARVAEQKAAA